jgi:hypothetical protein
VVLPVRVTVKINGMAVSSFLLLELEATLLVMSRFATVQAKICTGSASVSVISTIVRRTILALE